jgi:hypothetical protein
MAEQIVDNPYGQADRPKWPKADQRLFGMSDFR